MPGAALHVELAAADLKVRLADRVVRFAAVERQNKITEVNCSFGSADNRPLLVLGVKRAIKSGAPATIEHQLARKLDWHLSRPGLAGGGKSAPSHLHRKLIVHRPQREANVVPAEVAEAAERLQLLAGADVLEQKLAGA